MLRIAITGGIACGKSLLGSFLVEQGMAVCDADVLAHAEMAQGRPVYQAVRDAFGAAILTTDGDIDRVALGRLIFSDPARREQLNRLTHAAIQAAWERWLAEQRDRHARSAAVCVPLLYEAGLAQAWDVVLCVSAPHGVQCLRLAARGLTQAQAEERIAAQWPLAAKMKRADYVLCNCGSVALLQAQAQRVVRNLFGE